MTENEIGKQILDAAFAVHTKLGPGLLESVYEVVLAYELQKSGLTAERQKPIPILYDNIRFDEAFRSDLVVNWEGHCRTQICRSTASSACKTAAHATASKRPETGPVDQFRRSAPKEWDQTRN